MIENRLAENLKNKTIRRYMDYPKFLSFILERGLYFASPYEFEDKEEGFIPEYKKATAEIKEKGINPELAILSKEAIASVLKIIQDNMKYEQKKDFDRYYVYYFVHNLLTNMFSSLKDYKLNFNEINSQAMRISDCLLNGNISLAEKILLELLGRKIDCSILLKKYFKDTIIINCWNFNNVESDLLWKTYGNKGIAIETTVNKLESALMIENDIICIIDCVKYCNIQNYEIQANSITFEEMGKFPELQDTTKHAFFKRECYKSEEELRVVIRDYQRYNKNDCFGGRLIKIRNNLCDFIDKIIISPYASSMEIRVVKNLLEKIGENNLANKVCQSSIT